MAKKQTLRLDLTAKNLTKAAFTGVNRGLNKIKRTAMRATAAIGRNMRGFQNQAAALIGILGGFQALVKGPAEFGEEMAKVGTLGEEARSRLAGFTDEVRDLAVESGIGPNELADGLFNVISAGTEASRAMEVLRASTKLAVAGSADLTSVVSGLSVVANAFNVQTTEGFKELSQNLFAAQVIGKTTIEDLSANVGKLGATFADSSIDVTQMFTALADITTVSSNTEEAATSLRAAITAILKPSDKLRRVMEDVGIPLGAAAFQGRNLGEIFAAISKRSKELNLPLAQVIGNVRAVTAAVTLGAENGERYNRALEKQQGFLGELDESYRLMQGTLNSVLKQFGQLLKVLAQEFSGGLLVGLDKALMSAIENVDKLRAEAVVMGLEMRLAFEKSLPAIRNTIDLVMMLIDGFVFSIRAAEKLVKTLNFRELTGLKLDVDFSEGRIEVHKKQYNELGDHIREKLKEIEKLSSEAAKQITLPGFSVFRLFKIDELGKAKDDLEALKEARREASKDLRGATADLKIANNQLVELGLEDDPTTTKLIELSERITQRAKNVFGGGNLGDDESLTKLENDLKRAKKALQETGTVGKEAIEEIEEAQRKLLGTVVTESTLTWLDKFKEKTKAAWGAFKDGVMAAVKTVKDLEEKMKELGERLVQIAQSSLARFFDEIAAGTANSEEAFKRFTRSVLSEINRLMSEAIVRQFVTMVAGAFSGSTSVDTSQTFTQQTGITPPMSPLQGYSQGGIVTGPTAAMIGEGGMNEAVVPLPNGRSIPVQFSKGNAGGDNITININAVDGPSVERMLSSSSGRRAIEGVMRNAKSTRRDLR